MNKRLGKFLDSLKNSTMLAHYVVSRQMPEAVMNFFRDMADTSAADPELSKLKNPYEFAKKRLNKLWRGPDAVEGESPVKTMTTIRGLAASFWTSEKWKSANRNRLFLNGLSVVNGIFPAAIAYQGADLLTSLTQSGISGDFGQSFAYMLGLVTAGTVSRAQALLIANNLQRDMTQHIRHKFSEAMEQRPDIFSRLATEEPSEQSTDTETASLDHIIFTAPEKFSENAIYHESGMINRVVALSALGLMLWHNSVPIEIFENLATQINDWLPAGHIGSPGDKGTFLAAMATAVGFGVAINHKGRKIGRKTEDAQENKDKTSSRVKERLIKAFENNKDGAEMDSAIKRYKADIQVDESLAKKQDRAVLRHSVFMEGVSVINWPLSLVPSFLGAFSPSEGFKNLSEAGTQGFFITQAGTLMFLDEVSEIIKVISSKGELTVPRKQIVELAQKIEEQWHEKLDDTLKVSGNVSVQGTAIEKPQKPSLPLQASRPDV